MSDGALVRVETADGICRLTLQRPQVRNALNRALIDELLAGLAAAEANPDVRVIILTGGEQVFSAGADLREFAQMRVADLIRSETVSRWEALAQRRKPLIAAVGGMAFGGGFELVLHADIILASDTARFALPEILLGMMPGAGGTQRLTRLIGIYRAMEIILSGRPIDAEEAWRLGLVSRVVPAGELAAAADELAQTLVQRPPLSLQLAREAVRAAGEVGLADGLLLEQRSFELLFGTADRVEGLRAFLEKRPAQFRGE
jgi:enoyl-CoA hydratase